MTASASPAAAAARRMTSHLERVQPAAEGDDLVVRACAQPAASRSRVECCPRSSSAAGPVMITWPSSAPGDVEFAAVELDRGAALGQPAPVGGDQRGAGAAAAGRGDAGAALPDAQPDAARGRGPPRRRYWRAAETAGRCSRTGPSAREIDRFDIVDKKRRVRVADIGADRRRQRAQRQIDRDRCPSRGPAGCRASRSAPVPYRRRSSPSGSSFGLEQPGHGLDATRGSPVSR